MILDIDNSRGMRWWCYFKCSWSRTRALVVARAVREGTRQCVCACMCRVCKRCYFKCSWSGTRPSVVALAALAGEQQEKTYVTYVYDVSLCVSVRACACVCTRVPADLTFTRNTAVPNSTATQTDQGPKSNTTHTHIHTHARTHAHLMDRDVSFEPSLERSCVNFGVIARLS